MPELKHTPPSAWARLVEQLWQYGQLMRLHRPIGTLLLLWPTLWALWIAGDGKPDARVFLVFTLGILRRDRPAIAASLIAFFFFGGMLMSV